MRDKHNGDFVRTVDVLAADDFNKVGSAAASWARQRAKAMQLYGHAVRRELVLMLEWVDPPPAPKSAAPARSQRAAHTAKRRK